MQQTMTQVRREEEKTRRVQVRREEGPDFEGPLPYIHTYTRPSHYQATNEGDMRQGISTSGRDGGPTSDW